MVNVTIILLAALLLSVILHSEWFARPALRLYGKTLLSLLFVVAALVQPTAVPSYAFLILMMNSTIFTCQSHRVVPLR